MSRFYVGQRVRIVGAHVSKFLIGQEARVLALNTGGWSEQTGDYIGIKTDAINIKDRYFVALPGQLEPITDSYDVTSWDTCVWKPEHLRVGV